MSDAPPLVDERAARWAAGLVAPVRRDDPRDVAALRAEVARDLPAIDLAARAWTQLGQDLPPTRARVVGRGGFVTANLTALRGAFEPLRDRLERRRVIASRVLGAQLGAVLGLMSIKVLGQFVLPLGGDPLTEGRAGSTTADTNCVGDPGSNGARPASGAATAGTGATPATASAGATTHAATAGTGATTTAATAGTGVTTTAATRAAQPLGGGQLLVVGPNVLDLADEHGPLADDIRRTIVLHEVTHRLQFDGTPWLGAHLRGLMDRYLAASRTDPTELAELAPKLPEAIAEVKRTGNLQPLLQSVLTEEQAAVIGEAQGLMSLLEGHGNASMYAAADRTLIEDPDGVREAIAARRGDLTSKVLTAVAGLEMKRKQYRDGEAFVRAVVDEAGIVGLNHAFRGPDYLPSVEEVADPSAWLARVTD